MPKVAITSKKDTICLFKVDSSNKDAISAYIDRLR